MSLILNSGHKSFQCGLVAIFNLVENLASEYGTYVMNILFVCLNSYEAWSFAKEQQVVALVSCC
jgi:hypothetical protein